MQDGDKPKIDVEKLKKAKEIKAKQLSDDKMIKKNED